MSFWYPEEDDDEPDLNAADLYPDFEPLEDYDAPDDDD